MRVQADILDGGPDDRQATGLNAIPNCGSSALPVLDCAIVVD